MYLIEEGKAYFIKGDKAYKVSFDLNKNMKIDEEDCIDVKNQPKYTYDVMYRKLNIEYMVEKQKAEKSDNAIINSLKSENEKLKLEIKELKEALNKKPIEEQKSKVSIEETKKLNAKERK